MLITAYFSTWTIGDGTYDVIRKGDELKLSFFMTLGPGALRDHSAAPSFEHLGFANYAFAGKEIWRASYPAPAPRTVPIAIDCGPFRFYVESEGFPRPDQLPQVAGKGLLELDYYGWEESYRKEEGAPPLFYQGRVERILEVQPSASALARWKVLGDNAMANRGWGVEGVPGMQLGDLANARVREIADIDLLDGVGAYPLIEFRIDAGPGTEPLYSARRQGPRP